MPGKQFVLIGLHRSLPPIWNGTDFLICYVQLWQTKLFSKSFEANTLALCEIWKPLAPSVQEKASCLTAFLMIHERSRTSTAPSCLSCGWCKWKGVVYTYYYSTDRGLPEKLAWLHYLLRELTGALRYTCTAHAPINRLTLYVLGVNIFVVIVQPRI